jgi:hypothetical protein
VVATVEAALAKRGESLKSVEIWREAMPTEAEMLPRDKYTMFDRKEKKYRKGIHSEWFPPPAFLPHYSAGSVSSPTMDLLVSEMFEFSPSEMCGRVVGHVVLESE